MHKRRARIASVALLGFVPSVVACNAITGAGDLELERANNQGPGAQTAGAGAGSSGTTNPASTTSGGPTTGGPGSGGGSDPTTGSGGSMGTGQPDAMSDAEGVSITSIAIYQGVKRPLMAGGGSASSNIPIVAGRDALVRVFIKLDGAYKGTPVVGRLFLGQGSTPIESTTTFQGDSDEGSLNSTLNFDVPGASLGQSVNYRVELKQTAAGNPNPASAYPAAASGFDPMTVTSAGQTLKITIVPVAYGADGSSRLPDTSAAQIQAYRDGYYGVYPIPEVQVTVRAPFQWSGNIDASGDGWDNVLQAITDLREQDGAPADVYYMGTFAPASSFNNYCGNSCIAGLGNIGDANDSYSRGAVSLGFTGQQSVDDVVHETGHNHGRYHSPCGGASGTDPSYPYDNASIGVWGYDLVHRELFSPDQVADFMAYCDPRWVSDYTFIGLFERLKTVNNAFIVHPPESLNLTYERVRVSGTGALTWLTPMKLRRPPMGNSTVEVQLQSPNGTHAVTAQFYPYDHLEGGVLLWPVQATSYGAVAVPYAGKMNVLVH